MSKVLAIFGAGSGLGAGLARRFAAEGWRIALVARHPERLAKELTAEGIEAAAFPADLSDPVRARAVVNAVRERFGRIDVVSYQPLPAGTAFVPAGELDAARLAEFVNLYLLSAVEVAHAVLPEMVERGDGAFIVTGGFTAADPQPYLSGLGPAMAGVRNFVHSLHGEVKESGVHAGVVTLAALIKDSESYRAAGPTSMTVLDPADLADAYWRFYTESDRVEYRFPDQRLLVR